MLVDANCWQLACSPLTALFPRQPCFQDSPVSKTALSFRRRPVTETYPASLKLDAFATAVPALATAVPAILLFRQYCCRGNTAVPALAVDRFVRTNPKTGICKNTDPQENRQGLNIIATHICEP